jgi:hypothetical protein
MTFEAQPGHFSQRGAGYIDNDGSADVFPFPGRGLEVAEDTTEQEPRKVGAGDVVTIVVGGHEKRILITLDSNNFTGAVGGDKVEAQKAKKLDIDLINPIYPTPDPRRPQMKRPSTLAAQLVGKAEGAVVMLEASAKVVIKKIESLEELLSQVPDELPQ